MGDVMGPAVTVNTGDDFSVTSNEGTADEIKANFESDELKPDDQPADPKAEAKERVSKAASELGKKGGEAAAKARKTAIAEDETADAEKPEPKKVAKPEEKEAKEPERQKPESDKAADEQERHEEGRAKARIERLARERNEEREARRRAEAERDALKARTEAPQRDQAPQITDFATAEEYAEALAEHKVTQRERENEGRRRQEAQTQWNTDAIRKFHEKTKDGSGHSQRLHPSLDVEPAFLLDPKDVKMANVAAAELILSDYPLEVIDYIDQHEDELESMLAGSNWPDVVRGFARINERIRLQKEAKGKEPAKEPEKRGSSAAPPARQIPSSTQDGDEDVDGDDVDFERFVKVHNARDQRARRGR